MNWRRVKKGRPLISVILPTYNAGHLLAKTINSLAGQRYPWLERIVIDGGSTDSTLTIIRENEQHIDYWTSEPDLGVYDAMNKGVAAANGDWLYFLGAGDILVNILHRLAPRLQTPNCIYYGDVYWPSQNRLYDGEFKWYKLIHKNICHQAMFYPRAVFQSHRYALDYTVCADYYLNLKLWADRRFKFRYLPLLICICEDRIGKSRLERDDAFENERQLLVAATFKGAVRRREAYQRIRTAVATTLLRLLSTTSTAQERQGDASGLARKAPPNQSPKTGEHTRTEESNADAFSSSGDTRL